MPVPVPAGCDPAAAPGQQQGEARRRRGHGFLTSSPPGVSTTTFVDLITATASTPGSSPSSRTASLLISETTRCGPHCISTWAITLSVITSVTSPTRRLRAERPTSDGSGAAFACLRANAASAAPSTTLRFDASVCTGRVPASTHRRTVSSLTPSSRAASAIRNCGMKRTLTPLLRIHTAGVGYPVGPEAGTWPSSAIA